VAQDQALPLRTSEQARTRPKIWAAILQAQACPLPGTDQLLD